jgi:exodeoxyribonuclease-3
MNKGLIQWISASQPDVLCLQEIKATPDQVDVSEFEALGYYMYWYPAQKKGYSGVAIFTKTAPIHVEYGCGIDAYDFEGRVIRADFENCSIISVYHPSGSSGEDRQAFKMQWLVDFQKYIDILKVKIPNLIICGDYNICHKPIDIHNPKSNANTSGFLPEEREWMEQFIQSGFTDSFRHFNQEPHQYSWWSYRAGARGKLTRAVILPDAMHSDHCPVLVELEF